MDSTCTTNINDHARLPILHPEVLGRSTNQLKRRRIVNSQHSIPLFIRNLDQLATLHTNTYTYMYIYIYHQERKEGRGNKPYESPHPT